MSRLLISAAHKSSGKTTISIGICAALSADGVSVAPFKKGPDYIDPLWLGMASGRPCHTLDFHTSGHDEILQTYAAASHGAAISLIEGNKGLYDGMDLDGSNSNAALAKLLRAPVVLVVDTRGTIRGIAPLLLGYQQFDREIQIAGVILNQVGGSRHEKKLRAVIEHYTDIPVLGAVGRNEELGILERHLGLVPGNEAPLAQERIDTIARIVRAEVDIHALRRIADSAPTLPSAPISMPAGVRAPDVTIGIAQDSAFGFYYPSDLLQFEKAGARLIAFDTLHDRQLPVVDGLFIGGGFPETHMAELERNESMLTAIRDAIEAGIPAYAECGGLMYLSRSLRWREKRCAMVGVLPMDIEMHERPQGRGYVRLEQSQESPWRVTTENSAETIAAHEFHYSAVTGALPDLPCAYTVKRGQGLDGRRDGLIYRNLLASYSHLRHTARTPWVDHFVEFVRACRRRRP